MAKKIYYLAKDTRQAVTLCSGPYTSKIKLMKDHSDPKYKKEPYYINWVWDDEDGRCQFKKLQYLQEVYGKIVL